MATLVQLARVGGLCGLVLACATSGPTPSPACPSPVIDRGGGWQEIGGPRAWLLYGGPFYVSARGAHRLWVRVEGRLPLYVVTLAGRQEGGPEVEGYVHWIKVADPGPPPDLGGTVYFASLPLREPGCWEIVIGSDDEQLGSAFIDVQPLPPDSPSPGP